MSLVDVFQEENEQQDRMFSLDPVQYSFGAQLQSMVVVNSILIVDLNVKLLKINLDFIDAVEEIVIPPVSSSSASLPSVPRRLFLDDTASHLLLSSNGETYYLNIQTKKLKLLSKFKGITVTAIGWGRSTAKSTGTFLFGGANGNLYQGSITFDNSSIDASMALVYTLGDFAIQGIYFSKFLKGQSQKIVVLVCTSNKLVEFIVDDFTNKLFSPSIDDIASMQELPGNIDWSGLAISCGKDETVPQKWAWLTEPGVFCGEFSFQSTKVGKSSVLKESNLIPYPETITENSTLLVQSAPISISLTDYHILMLFKDRVKAVSLLNRNLVYEDIIPLVPGEKVVGLYSDLLKHTFWILTSLHLYELLVLDEDRDIWKIYLEKNNFELAMKFAKTAAQKENVSVRQANFYFAQKKFDLAATYYAVSKSFSFEEIALKFLALKDKEPLKIFLMKRLETLTRKDITQSTMICTWLTEIMLNEINCTEEALRLSKAALDRDPGDSTSTHQTDYEKLSAIFSAAIRDFRNFLTTYKDRLHVTTVYKLIHSHNRVDEFIFYAGEIKDWERLLDYYLSQQDWKNALESLSHHSIVDLYYKSSNILMENVPEETVNLWMRQSKLNPKHLLPALLKYNLASTRKLHEKNEAIRYLQFVITNFENRDQIIHNFFLSLLVQAAQLDGESSLLEFLTQQKHFHYFDVHYALRLCNRYGLVNSSIHLYKTMGMYESAVDLALQMNNIELARMNADRQHDSKPFLKKKLWIKIAKHIIQTKHDIKEALSYLKYSNSILKLEDILPYFPDFVLIDDLKDEICTALESYTEEIQDLKIELAEAIKSAETIRLDIREFKQRYTKVPVDKTCAICSLPCIIRQFFVFPCEHMFHADCLIKEVLLDSSSHKAQRIAYLQKEITTERKSILQTEEAPDALARNASLNKNYDLLNDLVAGECIYCGEAMINSLDKPFLTKEDTPWD